MKSARHLLLSAIIPCICFPALASEQFENLLTTQAESGVLAGWKAFHEDPGTRTGDVWKLADGVLTCKGSPVIYGCSSLSLFFLISRVLRFNALASS